MEHNSLQDIHYFEALFKENYTTLCKIAGGYFRDSDTVEDIVCDTFVKLWNHRDRIEIKTSVQDYLIKSLVNNCIDLYRQEKKFANKTVSINDEDSIVCHTLADLDQNPLDYLLTKEQHEKLEEAIEQLPPRYKETFKLICMDEMSYNEAASIMNISKNTIKSNLRDAMRILRESFRKNSIITLLIISRLFFIG